MSNEIYGVHDDFHKCYICNCVIIGLENYVNHRKYQCSVVNPKTKILQNDKSLLHIGGNNDYNDEGIDNVNIEVVDYPHPFSTEEISPNYDRSKNYHLDTVSYPQNSIQIEIANSEIDTCHIRTTPSKPLDVNTLDTSCTTSTTCSDAKNNSQLSYSSPRLEPEENSRSDIAKIADSVTFEEFVASLELIPQTNIQDKQDSQPFVSVTVNKTCTVETTHQCESASVMENVNDKKITLELTNVSITSPDEQLLTNDDKVKHSFNGATAVSLRDTPKQSTFEERLKNIKIANILPDVEFSSDSEDLPSDVDEFLNLSDEDHRDISLITGGKWRPGGKGKFNVGVGKFVTGGKHGKKGKDINSSISGKWKPGTQPATANSRWISGQRVIHSQGKHSKLHSYKIQRLRGLTDSEDEPGKEDVSGTHSSCGSKEKKKRSGENKHFCDVCKKSYKSEESLKLHRQSTSHKKKAQATLPRQDKQPVQCQVCNKTISNKYNYARHLALSHKMSENDDEYMKIVASSKDFEKMLLKCKNYQCQICSFFCDSFTELKNHIQCSNHVNTCSNLLGSILCKKCKFECNNNADLLVHFDTSSIHNINVTTTCKSGCIIKEKRTNLKCKQCDKVVHSLTKLKEHMKSIHSTSRTVQSTVCDICKIQFRSHSSLQIHICRKHTKEKPFPCLICNVHFASNSDLLRHNRTEKHLDATVERGVKISALKVKDEIDRTKLVCEFRDCNFEALTKKALKKHCTEKHKRFNCDKCNYSVNKKSHWDAHCQTEKHKKLSSNSVIEVKTKMDPKFVCSFCEEIFKNSKTLKLHKMNKVCQLANQNQDIEVLEDKVKCIDVKYRSFVNSLSSDFSKEMTCPETGCEKVFRTKLEMVNHLVNKSPVKPFTCVYCRKAFQRVDSLHAHLQQYHLATNFYQCDFCSKKFSQKIYLDQHVFTSHSSQKKIEAKYQCDNCEFKCVNVTSLTSHITKHNGKMKKIQCPWKGCLKAFPNSSLMNRHFQCHTNQKAHKCNICSYQTRFLCNLKVHKRRHFNFRRFKCEYCTYSTVTSSRLKRHMAIHINARAFQCPYVEHCSFTANSLDRMHRHVNFNKKHVLNKQFLYPCKNCYSSFRKRSELQRHLISSHGENIDIEKLNATFLHPDMKCKEKYDLQGVLPGQKVNPIAEKYVNRMYEHNRQDFIADLRDIKK